MNPGSGKTGSPTLADPAKPDGAAQKLAPANTRFEIFELDGIPGYNQDDERNPPPRVAELKARVRAADAILFVTPEYNY